MPNEASLAEIETAELILAVDAGRAPTDTFKLPAYLLALVIARLADLRTKDAATLITEGGRVGGQINVRTALDTLNGLLHDGYNFIKGIGSYTITASVRAEAFTAYGWHRQTGPSVSAGAAGPDSGAARHRELEPDSGHRRHGADSNGLARQGIEGAGNSQ